MGSGQRPSRRKQRIAAAIVAATPLLALIGYVGSRQHLGDLEEQLVRRANELGAYRPGRPPRSLGLGGSVADLLQPAFIRIDSAMRGEGWDELLSELDQLDGHAGPLTIPSASLVELVLEDVHQALLASRALVADPGPGLRNIWLGHSELEDRGLGVFWAATRIAAHEVAMIARTDPDGALAVCLDGLALSRDVAIQGSPHAISMAKRATFRLLDPCVRAIDGASAHAIRTAMVELDGLARSAPDMERMLEGEMLAFAFANLRPTLGERHRRELGEDAIGVLMHFPEESGGIGAALLGRDSIPDVVIAFDEIKSAFALPRLSGARDVALAAARERRLRAWNPLPFLQTMEYRRFEHQASETRAALGLLAELAAIEIEPGLARRPDPPEGEEGVYLTWRGRDIQARLVMVREEGSADVVAALRPREEDGHEQGHRRAHDEDAPEKLGNRRAPEAHAVDGSKDPRPAERRPE